MTPNQIKKILVAGGMDMSAVHEISRDEVEVFVDNGQGRANDRKTDKARRQLTKILGWKGGYKTGYGGWVMQANPINMGDWNDKSSRHHY